MHLNEVEEKRRCGRRWQAFCRLLVCFCSISQCVGGGGKEAGNDSNGKLFANLLFVLLCKCGGGKEKGVGNDDELFVNLFFVFVAFLNAVEKEQKRRVTTAMASCTNLFFVVVAAFHNPEKRRKRYGQ